MSFMGHESKVSSLCLWASVVRFSSPEMTWGEMH